MIAYNTTYLRNIAIVKKAKLWFSHRLISPEQMATTLKKYDAPFYKPNLFIKIGLFIFTCVLISAALGFYCLFAYSGNHDLGSGFASFTCFLFAVGCFVCLELFIKNNKLYNSGIDDALLYSALSFLFSGICIMVDTTTDNRILFSLAFFFPFVVMAAIRYVDTPVTLAAALCMYAIFFYALLNIGAVAKLIMPFPLMLFSVPVFFIARKQKQNDAYFLWKHCVAVCEAVALILFYLACNYFVIRESSIAFFDMKLEDGQNIPLAFLFYFLTATVPLLYTYYALKTKNKTILLISLLLITTSALTFKYYFSLHHPEITLTGAGIIMILIAYFSIKYLKTDKHSISFKENVNEDNFLKKNAEALIIAQSFSSQATNQHQNDSNTFGGGDFGGGGSGNSY